MSTSTDLSTYQSYHGLPPLAGLCSIAEAARPSRMAPVRWGRIVGSRSVEWMAVGFPDAQARPDQVRDTAQASGTFDGYVMRPLASFTSMTTRFMPRAAIVSSMGR